MNAPRAAQVRTLRAVDAGEELTHSYVDLCLSTAQRREILASRYGIGQCECARCADGVDVDGRLLDELLHAQAPGISAGESAEAVARSAAKLRAAMATEDEDEEMELTVEALRIRYAAQTRRWLTRGAGMPHSAVQLTP